MVSQFFSQVSESLGAPERRQVERRRNRILMILARLRVSRFLDNSKVAKPNF
jgi:hypothetical protein